MELSAALFVGLVALIAIQRFAELHRSRRHVAVASEGGRQVEREPMYTAMVAVHTGALFGCAGEVVFLHRPFIPALAAPALFVLACAQLSRIAIFRALGSSWSTRVVRPARLVTAGPYRLVRHPNYAIVCVELVALPLVHTAWCTALVATLANAWVLSRRIPMEERVLARDPAWREAFDGVPRLLPRWRRR